MTYPIIQPSFTAGELSPQLYSRVDYDKYHVGLARCYNCIVSFRGGILNRPGTQYIIHCYDQNSPVKLIPFKFSTIQNYVLEFGSAYMRPFMNGGTILEAPVVITGITQANPGVVTSAAHGYNVGDIVFVAGVIGMTQVNGRYFYISAVTLNTFTLANLDRVNISTAAYTAYSSAGTAARVYMISSPYAAADIARLKFSQSADTMTITHPSYPTYKLTRTGHTSWSFTQVNFSTSLATPVITSITASSVGGNTLSYRVTAVGANGEESAPSNVAAVDGGVPDVNVIIAWAAVAGAVSYNVYRATLAAAAYASGAYSRPYSGYGLLNTAYGTTYTDRAIFQNAVVQEPDFTISPPQHRNPFAIKDIRTVTVTAGGAGYTDATVVNIADATGVGAVLRPVVVAGALVSVIIENGGYNYTAPVITFTVGAGAATTNTLGPSTGTYPAVNSYYQQRAMYAASVSLPQTFWMSQTGAFDNMDVSNPVLASDAITGTIVAQQVNDIRSLVPMPSGIIAFTSDGAWEISGGTSGSPITPLTAQAKPQSYVGASYIQPLVVNYDVLYLQAKGNVVRDLSFNLYYNSYIAEDASTLADHLFYGYTILDWCWAQDPFRVVWACRSDGVILSLTFDKEQKVNGWAQHATVFGGPETICSVPEGSEDSVYWACGRTLNGTPHKFIEKMFSRNYQNNIVNSRFLDCALEYVGAPVSVLTGLEHLEGMLVSVLADGVETPGVLVANRQITLAAPASNVVAGLPYTSEIQTLAVETSVEKGTIQGRYKRITTVTARVVQSRGLQMGSAFDKLKASKVTATVSTSPFGTWTNGLFSGDDRMVIDPASTEMGQVCIRQSHPWPMMITGIIPGLDTGDTPG